MSNAGLAKCMSLSGQLNRVDWLGAMYRNPTQVYLKKLFALKTVKHWIRSIL